MHATTTRRAAAAAVAAVMALVLAACGDAGSEGAVDSLTSDAVDRSGDVAIEVTSAAAAVQEAGTNSAAQPTMRATVRIEADGEVISETEGLGDMTGTMFEGTTTLPGFGSAGYRLVDGIAYIEVPGLPDGATWLAISVEELSAQTGVDYGVQQSPTSMLSALESLGGQVSEVGTEDVAGEPTTHYRVTTTAEDLIANSAANGMLQDEALAATEVFTGPVELDVWIDANDLVRRMTYTMSIAPGSPGMPFSEFTYEFEFSDYGEPLDVTAPPPETVISMADALSVPN
jgi:hypothetical protein